MQSRKGRKMSRKPAKTKTEAVVQFAAGLALISLGIGVVYGVGNAIGAAFSGIIIGLAVAPIIYIACSDYGY